MDSWGAVFAGDRTALAQANMPGHVKSAVLELLALYPADRPIAQRVQRRPKDPARPIQLAEGADGIKYEVANYKDVEMTHKGTFRVSLQGNPEANGTIRIEIDPEFVGAEVSEKTVFESDR